MPVRRAMLALIIGTKLYWPTGLGFARYDFLFLAALAIQLAMLVFRLETLAEAKVILIFHVVGTIMEIFKTDVGSWIYPEANVFRIGGVPLFSGFMYAAVGSYLARVSRIFDMRYSHYPPLWATVFLAAAIYVNFYAHHFVADMRTCCSPPPPCCSCVPPCTIACSASGTVCPCSSAFSWSLSSSGLPRTSALGPRAWMYPGQATAGRRCPSTSWAPGTC